MILHIKYTRPLSERQKYNTSDQEEINFLVRENYVIPSAQDNVIGADYRIALFASKKDAIVSRYSNEEYLVKEFSNKSFEERLELFDYLRDHRGHEAAGIDDDTDSEMLSEFDKKAVAAALSGVWVVAEHSCKPSDNRPWKRAASHTYMWLETAQEYLENTLKGGRCQWSVYVTSSRKDALKRIFEGKEGYGQSVRI